MIGQVAHDPFLGFISFKLFIGEGNAGKLSFLVILLSSGINNRAGGGAGCFRARHSDKLVEEMSCYFLLDEKPNVMT